jgi:hypothetical protein
MRNGSPIPVATCEAACGADGDGDKSCDKMDMGCPSSKTWGPSYGRSWGSTAILPGKFGSTGVAPVEGNMSSYKYSWVTVGGADTSSGGWEKTAEQDIIQAGAGGCAFDEEGGVSASVAGPWITKQRSSHPEWTFVYIPQCGTKILKYDPANGGCDYIAPMMYYSNGDSYPNMDFTTGGGNVADCLQKIQENGWPNSRTILTYQSFDAFRLGGNHSSSKEAHTESLNHVLSGGGCTGCAKGGSEGEGLLMTLGQLTGDHSVSISYWGEKNLVMQGPFAGAIGWPAQCGGAGRKCWPGMDHYNQKIVLEAAGMPGGN